jgi:hypothetical protein
MLFEPTLQIEKLLILKGGKEAFSAQFHDGINIISGENSSGKSTILSLLVYGLGADITSWSEHARLCDRVSLQVSFNGIVATLSREINTKAGQPMDIFPGDLRSAEAAPRDAWMRFPYRSTGNRETFSQAIFRLLNLPELETETSGKLTMHQVLRVLYSDQLSSVEHIFRDDNFDTPALRDAVGRLLMGAYDAEIYSNQLKIRELEKELQAVQNALRSLYAVLGNVQHSLTVEWARAEQERIRENIQNVEAEIISLQAQIASQSMEALSLQPQAAVQAKIASLQASIAASDEKINALSLEIADSELFILTLTRKVEALQDSSAVADEVSEIQFTVCPSCLAPIKSDVVGACHLCKETLDEDRLRRRIVSQLNQMTTQLKQSRELQVERHKELERLQSERRQLLAAWEDASRNLRIVTSGPVSAERAKLRELDERHGYLRRELESAQEKMGLIEQLDEMSRRREEVSGEIVSLTDRNDRLRATEREKLLNAYTLVADETANLLRKDLPRQDSFQSARSVNFNFAKDTISVDGQSYFSASSTVYLKNAFLSAFLFAAASDKQFRHPRFLILDTIEDKGMEPERSQNFQALLVERSSEIEAKHQIIFATAMINPELDNEDYVIGKRSTHDQRTLNLLG